MFLEDFPTSRSDLWEGWQLVRRVDQETEQNKREEEPISSSRPFLLSLSSSHPLRLPPPFRNASVKKFRPWNGGGGGRNFRAGRRRRRIASARAASPSSARKIITRGGRGGRRGERDHRKRRRRRRRRPHESIAGGGSPKERR